ncbi:hypothetical protein HZS_6221 [Henneguya salminicola]|nr:hypothetical protein HZS_6221 [Henneguya salminicola]
MNAHVCDSVYNVYSYPTIKFFNCMENAGAKIHHDLAEIAKDRSIHSLRLATASLIVNQTKCPAITHSSYEFSQQFWEDFKSGMTRYNLMIVVIGTQNETRLVDSPKLTLLFGSFSKPTLIAINRTIHIEIISDENECPEINVFDTLISKPEFVAVNNETLNMFLYMNLILRNLQKNEIYMTDLITGIGMSLRNELSRQPFDTSLIGIIKNWITIIRECMYWQKPQHEFLDNLYLWLISQGNSLTNSDWAAFMRSNEALNAFPTNQTWITCKGSDPTYRGYPCSLWLSFHIMTVKCERMSVSSTIGSTDVLLYIREYILNFFGCQECREHFDELTKHVFDKILMEWS